MPDFFDQFHNRDDDQAAAQDLVYFHKFRPFATKDTALWSCVRWHPGNMWIELRQIRRADGVYPLERVHGSLDLASGAVHWGPEEGPNMEVQFARWLKQAEWDVANKALSAARST